MVLHISAVGGAAMGGCVTHCAACGQAMQVLRRTSRLLLEHIGSRHCLLQDQQAHWRLEMEPDVFCCK